MKHELLKIDRKAAKAYEGALRVLKDRQNPDRFSQSAHSIREVTNIISRKVSIPHKAKKDDKTLKKKLEKYLIEKPYLLPSPANREATALIRRWADLNQNFFVPICHHNEVTDEEDFLSKLSEFETILLHFIKPNPVTLKKLDSLLNIQSPTQKNIEELLELLRQHWTHTEYFFSNLAWPNWLEPLEKNGFFSEPPSRINEGDYIMVPTWPLCKCLIRISGQKPREVMNIIEDIKETDNYWVHIDLIECTLQMPSPIAKEIIPLARKWLKTSDIAPIAEKFGELAIKLCNDNDLESSLSLLSALLDVKRPESTSSLGEVQSYLNLWEYEQILQEVAPVLLQKTPYEVLEILCQKLSNAIELERLSGKNPICDLPNARRHAIEDHPLDEHYSDIKNLLVTAIRDNLENIGKKDGKVLKKYYKLLSDYDFIIFRRIELHLIRIFPALFENEIHAILSQKKLFEDKNLRYEYYHLLEDQYSRLPPNIKEKILSWIEEGPNLEKFVARHIRRRKELPSEKVKDMYKARWQIRQLAPIKDFVPLEWKERWNKLVTNYGEPEHPDLYNRIQVFYGGPFSPLTKEDIKEKTPQELIAYLRTWKPSEDILAPSREGLGRVLRDIVKENPSNYTEICHEFKTLQPVYIYYFIDGFNEALRNGNSFDWNPVISLCKDILMISKISDIQDDDYGWNSVEKEIGELLKEGLGNNIYSPPFNLRESIWEIIETLLQNEQPDLEYEEEYGGGELGSVTLSMNTARGSAVRCLIQYAVWCARNLDLIENENGIVPEAKKQLEEMLNPEFEPTKTIRSVYGFYLPTLFFLDEGWTKEHVRNIFPQDGQHRALWRAAWEGYMVPRHYSDDVYLAIRSQYKVAVNKLTSPKISSEIKRKLSEHLMIAYLRGTERLGENSLIRMFFEKAQSKIRAHAIRFIGEELRCLPEQEISEKEKKDVLKRVMDLWEWRIKKAIGVDNKARERFIPEFKWFRKWFIQDIFDKQWAISQLHKTLELTGGIMEFSDDVIDNLQDHIEENCTKVLRVLILLVKGDKEGWLFVSKGKVAGLLESLLVKCLHQEIKDDMNELVHWLTRRGHYEFQRFFIE